MAAPTTTLIGREQSVAEAAALLSPDDVRLLTITGRLHAEGRLDALYGAGGTAIATRAMWALPVGIPKLPRER